LTLNLFQMEPGLVLLIADMVVDFSQGRDGDGRAR
jgi:hypothetical protein